MATKSFLSAEEFALAPQILKPPMRPPDGDERRGLGQSSRDFSSWLTARLHARLRSHPDWEASEPVALGSWSREELCPKSDIDLIFLGPEDRVARLVADFSREGLKLRSRVPEDLSDWTKGVEPFDVLALLSAMPLNATAAEKLATEQLRLQARSREFRKNLLKAMRVERLARGERYDSISNFLEPNLKYGPGGLRDLEQALATRQLFHERFEGNEHAFHVLLYYKTFFVLIRQRLHLASGASDVLSAPEQGPISDWLGYKSAKDFMREVQKGLSRVSFYADWVIAQATSSAAKIAAATVEATRLTKPSAFFLALRRDPSILMQNHVRLSADPVFAKEQMHAGRLIGQQLTRILDPKESEASMVALFRSRLIDWCVPEFKRIVGHVQHDQYHRFAVDAHLLQVLRELKRLCQKPKRAGRLVDIVRSITKREWDVLAFSSLYHDLAKGRGGDHAIKGIEIAKDDLTRFGKDESFIDDVCWIVEEHLALSAAAFRENPRAPRTWRTLADRGVEGRRLALLAVFTIVDIKGTNPDAWTPWKERLLFELVQQLERPEVNALVTFARDLKGSKIKSWERFSETLDPFLVGSLPSKTLVADLTRALQSRRTKKLEDLGPRVVRARGGTWIRFHETHDKPGLFLGYVRKLAQNGLGVRHASILTDSELGVYDWFEVKTSKNVQQITKLLGTTGASGAEKAYVVRFDDIELVSSDEKEWVISFRGRDQIGALAAAASALFEERAEIHWAKVHTWGRQIDDVFGIGKLPGTEPHELIARLAKRLQVNDGPKV